MVLVSISELRNATEKVRLALLAYFGDEGEDEEEDPYSNYCVTIFARAPACSDPGKVEY